MARSEAPSNLLKVGSHHNSVALFVTVFGFENSRVKNEGRKRMVKRWKDAQHDSTLIKTVRKNLIRLEIFNKVAETRI